MRRERCGSGHPLAVPNLILKPASARRPARRQCRVCQLEYMRRHFRRERNSSRTYSIEHRRRAILAAAESELVSA